MGETEHDDAQRDRDPHRQQDRVVLLRQGFPPEVSARRKRGGGAGMAARREPRS
jgi:hypothetical protein